METRERFGYDDAARARDYVIERLQSNGMTSENVKDGAILGSGLGGFAEDYIEKGAFDISFEEIFKSLGIHGNLQDIPGHKKKLIIGLLKRQGGVRYLLAQAGREHPYEGVGIRRAVFWIRVMQLLGVETLFSSNAAGVVTPNTLYVPSLMLVHSHYDFGPENPLIGQNNHEFGPRFPAMDDLYPLKTRNLVKDAAKKLSIPLTEGMLLRVPGPQYESATDVYRLRSFVDGIWDEGRKQPGEDRFHGYPVAVVGMSSTYEHLVAKHASGKAFGKARAHISVATNYAAGLGEKGIETLPSHDVVEANAHMVQEKFGRLLYSVLLEAAK